MRPIIGCMVVMLLLVVCKLTLATRYVCKDRSKLSESESVEDPSEPCFDLQQFQYTLNQNAEVNKSIELECYVRNKGSYSIIWLYENQLISVDDRIIKPDSRLKLDSDLNARFNLVINGIDSSNKGVYTCQIGTKQAKNLEYNLDVLTPPRISRMPASDIISLNEGESLTVQCFAEGNPKPKLTWSKRGEKSEHTVIDELKSTLTLENVDESYTDLYSCTAKNDIGSPVSSEFQIIINFKPKTSFQEHTSIHNGSLYSKIGNKEQIKCLVTSYPEPNITLLLNEAPILPELYTVEQSKDSDRLYSLTYSVVISPETVGTYRCVGENPIGQSSKELQVTTQVSELVLTNENLPVYSDAMIVEWLAYSGSAISELNFEVQAESELNATSIVVKTKHTSSDGVEQQPTYHNEHVLYKDLYDLSNLKANTSYTVRIRVKNTDAAEYSAWSKSLQIKTLADGGEKMNHKHKAFWHHHHRHDRLGKHKNHHAMQTGSRDLNGKQRYNYFSDNSASTQTQQALFARYTLLGLSVMIVKLSV